MTLKLPDHDVWEGWVTLGLIGAMLVALVGELAPPYLVMMGTLIIFLPLDILNIEEAFHGFADEAMLSVAVLFVVAKGIENSGGLEYVSKVLFSTKKKKLKPGQVPSKSANSIVWVLLKFSIPVAIFSAFLANIPLVAMMIPPIVEFGGKVNLSPSKMLIPLSYAAQLGGTLTLIGATTNLVVLSLASKKVPTLKMNLFEIGIIGMPVMIAGIFYIIALSSKLLPNRLAIQQTSINAREYNVVLVVKQKSSLSGKTIEQTGAQHQPGLHLLQIIRDGNKISTPPADFILQPKDHLQFSGVIDSVLSLARFDGLALSEDEGQEQVDLNKLKVNQCLVEAVVALGSPMVRKKVAELQFRARYKAAIVAIHRHAKRLESAIGDIVLEAGDSLLMVADGPEFVAKHRNNSTFSLVAKLPGFVPIQRGKAGIAAILVLGMVVGSGIGYRLITAALFSAAGLLMTGSLTPADAMESIELPVLIMISAAFGISEAMVISGAADIVARALMGLAGKSMFGLITCTYVATTIFSLAITNNAAVTIMFPVALAAAQSQQLDFRPFAYTLMMASSAGFMTPTGCPTNLMVYQPGGYKFLDFITYGGLLQILLGVITVGLTLTLKWWWAWWLVIFLVSIALTPLLAKADYNLPKADVHEDNTHYIEPTENAVAASHDESMEAHMLQNSMSSSSRYPTSIAEPSNGPALVVTEHSVHLDPYNISYPSTSTSRTSYKTPVGVNNFTSTSRTSSKTSAEVNNNPFSSTTLIPSYNEETSIAIQPISAPLGSNGLENMSFTQAKLLHDRVSAFFPSSSLELASKSSFDTLFNSTLIMDSKRITSLDEASISGHTSLDEGPKSTMNMESLSSISLSSNFEHLDSPASLNVHPDQIGENKVIQPTEDNKFDDNGGSQTSSLVPFVNNYSYDPSTFTDL